MCAVNEFEYWKQLKRVWDSLRGFRPIDINNKCVAEAFSGFYTGNHVGHINVQQGFPVLYCHPLVCNGILQISQGTNNHKPKTFAVSNHLSPFATRYSGVDILTSAKFKVTQSSHSQLILQVAIGHQTQTQAKPTQSTGRNKKKLLPQVENKTGIC